MARGRGRGRGGRGRGRGGSSNVGNPGEPEFRKSDVFEAEDSDPEEDKQAGKRYDLVDDYEYKLPSDFEDEEIEEDEAFNSEDERMYGHLFTKKPRRGGGDSEDPSSSSGDDEMSGSEDDLLTSDEDSGEEGSEAEDELDEIFGASGSSSDEDEQEEDNLTGGRPLDEEEEGEQDAHDAMLRAVSGGNAVKMAAKRRKRDVVVTEAYPESQFNLPSGGHGKELTLTDLISGLGDSKAKLGSARKELERLERRTAPVPAPLPGPIRDRQERRAGYEAAKEDVTKWMPLVKANREAPTVHFKSDASEVPKTVTTASLVAKHTPETAMEREVAALLAAAGAQSAAAVAEAEDALAMKSLSVAEARERREKLAKMRALLFYHEVKAKRMKKIKSKEYRRRMKKAEKRRAEAAGGADGLDGLLDPEMLRQELEDAEFQRAKERLTLKHKNTSRFIRRAIKRGALQLDEGTKEAVEEQLRLGQELRSRVHRMKASGGGKGGSDDDTYASDDSDATTSGSEDEGGPSGRGLSSKARAAALELLQGGQGGDVVAPGKGLFALPFMQRAMERRKVEAQEEARAMLELDEGGGGGGGRDGPTAGGSNGRRAFGGNDIAARHAERVRRLEAAALASDSELDSDADEDTEAKAQRLGRKLRGDGPEGEEPAAETSAALIARNRHAKTGVLSHQNLFEAAHGSARKKVSTKDSVEVTVGPASGKKNGAAAAATDISLNEQQQQHPFVRSKKFQGPKDGYVFKKGPQGVGYYFDSKQAAVAAKQAKQKAAISQKQKQKQQPVEANGSDDDNEGNMRPADAAGPSFGMSQEDLVRQAFAGDDVVAEFAADKAAEVEGELPNEEVPGALPGWGTWASQQREPRWAVEAKAKAAAKRAAAAASRKDAGLQYVVISEKWDKRNSKYRTPSVPFPFDSKETYERAMRQPLGREFNTDEAFRNLTRPAIIKDAGVIIQPIRYSSAMADHSTKTETGSKRAPVLTVAGGMPKRAKKKV